MINKSPLLFVDLSLEFVKLALWGAMKWTIFLKKNNVICCGLYFITNRKTINIEVASIENVIWSASNVYQQSEKEAKPIKHAMIQAIQRNLTTFQFVSPELPCSMFDELNWIRIVKYVVIAETIWNLP